MNTIMIRGIKQRMDAIGVLSRADVTHNEKTDLYNFDFGRFQIQVKNIFDQGDFPEDQLVDFITNMFLHMDFLLEEVIQLQRMFDTQNYAMFLNTAVAKEHQERLNLYITVLEDHIGIEHTSADEYNDMTIGDKD